MSNLGFQALNINNRPDVRLAVVFDSGAKAYLSIARVDDYLSRAEDDPSCKAFVARRYKEAAVYEGVAKPATPEVVVQIADGKASFALGTDAGPIRTKDDIAERAVFPLTELTLPSLIRRSVEMSTGSSARDVITEDLF